MQVKIQKWGNSLALRIPKHLAKDSYVGLGSLVDLSLENGQLIITPINRLETLLAEVTPDNIHSEIDTGFPVGNEVW